MLSQKLLIDQMENKKKNMLHLLKIIEIEVNLDKVSKRILKAKPPHQEIINFKKEEVNFF